MAEAADTRQMIHVGRLRAVPARQIPADIRRGDEEEETGGQPDVPAEAPAPGFLFLRWHRPWNPRDRVLAMTPGPGSPPVAGAEGDFSSWITTDAPETRPVSPSSAGITSKIDGACSHRTLCP